MKLSRDKQKRTCLRCNSSAAVFIEKVTFEGKIFDFLYCKTCDLMWLPAASEGFPLGLKEVELQDLKEPSSM